jgi:hypothetical protein
MPTSPDVDRWGILQSGRIGGCMDDKAAFHWLEAASSVLIRFGDLPAMMAAAQFSEDTERGALSRVVAEGNIGARLAHMVANGALTVRNRHGLNRLDAPGGQQLKDAVLIPEIDLSPLRAEFGIGVRFKPCGSGPDLWTIERAAGAIAEQEAWHDEARDTLRRQMLQAARDGRLRVRHPHTDLPIDGEKRENVRDWYELVTREDVNQWLEAQGAAYRWRVVQSDIEARQGQPKATVQQPADTMKHGEGPPALTTPGISEAFDGITERSAKQWRDMLGDVKNHQWVMPARVEAGKAPNPSRWCPLTLARILLERVPSPEREPCTESLNRRFLNEPALKPWLAAWQEDRRQRNAFGM